MADTTFRPGDYEHCILRKWLDELGGDFQFGDSFWTLLRKILAQIPGPEVFRVGDSSPNLLRKILINSGGDWQPGDSVNNLWRKILDQQAAGGAENEWKPGDYDHPIERKILERVSGSGPEPPEPPTIPEAPDNARLEAFVEDCGAFSASFTIAWDDNSDDESGFEVWRDVGGGGFELYQTVGPGVTFINEVFPPATWGAIQYDYKVLAFNDAGSSAFSNTVTVIGGCS